jgi:putative membrane protein
MGTADLIPGVSGGTIAFLSGIYEELLYSIKLVTGKVLRTALRGQIVAAFRMIPFRFLLPLGIGILSAVFLLANIMSWLLQNYPVFVWAFFFGLVLASTFVVARRVTSWRLAQIIGFIVAAAATFLVVNAVPVQTPPDLWFFFVSGMIAICAMILPGISGSFILVLLGQYERVLNAVVQRDVITLAVFIAGCVVGIAIFSRVLTWLFREHHDISVAVLSGIMLGSVAKIWPWKEVTDFRTNSHGDLVPLADRNILPAAFDETVIFAIVLAVVGAGLVLLFDRLQLLREQNRDLGDAEYEQTHEGTLATPGR